MAAELKDWYRLAGSKLSERDLYAAVEREFGRRITDEVCIPYGVHAGACLVGAVLVCREADPA